MDRLGYSRYGIQGGDWGSLIARDIAHEAPSHVIGLHLNFLPVGPPNTEAIARMTDHERKRFSYFERGESSFYNLQASESQTLAYALTDSPLGWLAWMIDKFQMLTDNDGDFLNAVDRDTFLSDVTLYWVTGTVGSAMRIYREHRLSGGESAPLPKIAAPIAYADFPKEVFASPVAWIEQTYNIVQVTEMPRGGHFAALEQPDLLVQDVRTFFAKVTNGAPAPTDFVALPDANTATTAGSAPGPTAESALAADEALARAIRENNAEEIVRLLDDGWTVISTAGRVGEGPSVFPDGIMSGGLKREIFELSEPRVRLNGDTALVTSKVKTSGTFRGKPFDVTERQTDVLHWTNGGWKCILTHETKIQNN